MPRKQLEKVLVAELGDLWRQKVADFEYEPLAAASIGQVSMLLDIRVLPAAVIIEPRLAATPCQAKQSEFMLLDLVQHPACLPALP
jgi:hypothetical protein